MAERVPMTKGGLLRLKEELKRLKNVERPKIVKEIAEARSHGDLSENAEYHAAKEKQSHVEGRIAQVEHWIASAEVIDVSKHAGDRVVFGATVALTSRPIASMNPFTSDIGRSLAEPSGHGIRGTGITRSPIRSVASTGASTLRMSLFLP